MVAAHPTRRTNSHNTAARALISERQCRPAGRPALIREKPVEFLKIGIVAVGIGACNTNGHAA
jgi:hypothetical protein